MPLSKGINRDTTGQVIETLPNHQYWVRVDGSGRITMWNHWFLQKLEIPTIPLPISSTVPKPPTPNPTRFHKPNTPVPLTVNTGITLPHPPSNTAQLPTMMQALSRLFPYNQPGLKKLIPPQRLLPMHDWGGG